jgi:hypothetical protein
MRSSHALLVLVVFSTNELLLVAPCDGPSPIDDAGDEQGVGRPHDLRVLPLAKAVPRRGRDQYQLAVDVSWQPPVDGIFSFRSPFSSAQTLHVVSPLFVSVSSLNPDLPLATSSRSRPPQPRIRR